MPTPSLNSASPSISTCSASGTRTFFSTLSTATGSVGLISAPNTMAHSSGTGRPTARLAPQKAKPTIRVEIKVPTTARVSTGRARLRSASKLTCMDPANSRNDSMPFITIPVKSNSRKVRVRSPYSDL